MKSKKIIPAILVKNFEEFEEKINLVEPFVQMVQVDVMDNEFVPNQTFADPLEIKKIKTSLDFEIHLMTKVENLNLESWKELGVKRVIVHFEACKDELEEVIEKVKSFAQIGIAINPKTPSEVLLPYINQIDYVLIMTVEPGFGGQKFMPEVLKKVVQVKEMGNKEVLVAIDGGVDEETIVLSKKAGVDLFSANSSIFKNESIEEAIRKLDSLVY